MDTEYVDAVWVDVAGRFGAIGPDARAAHAAAIAHCASRGMRVADAAEVVAARMGGAREALDAGLAAFNRLVAAIEFAGRVIQGPVAVEDTMEHLLASKVGLAELFLYLAGVAREADAPGVQTVEEAAQMVTESRAEHAAWQEANSG